MLTKNLTPSQIKLVRYLANRVAQLKKDKILPIESRFLEVITRQAVFYIRHKEDHWETNPSKEKLDERKEQ
jgi:hypothetical protein